MTLRDVSVGIDVDINSSPLEILNREIDEMLSLFGSLDFGSFDELERELRRLTQDFDLLEDSVDDFDDSLDDIDDSSLSDVTEEASIATKAMDALKVGVLAVGAALGGIAMSIGAFAMEADNAFARLSAQTGASAAEMATLKDAAYDTFSRGYGESLDEVTEAMSRVKQNMHSINDTELSDVTSNAMLLANVFDSEINEVTRGAQGLMDAFGISSEKAFDLFTKGGQSGINMSDDMFDQMAEFSSVAAQAGYTAEELFGVMSRGAQNGVYNMDRVNNAILEFGLRSTDGSKGTTEAFKELSKDTQKLWGDMLAGKATAKDLSNAVINELQAMDDQTLANEVGIALWGTTWEDNTKDVMYAMFETTEALEGFEGATAAAADAVEGTFKNRMLGVWRDLQTGINEVVSNPAAQEFFDLIATKAEEMVPYILAGVDGLLEFGASVIDGTSAVNEFIDTYGFLIAGIAGGVATYYVITGAVAAYNAILLAAAGTGPLYTAATAMMTAGTTAFGAAVAFATSPVFLISAGIAALIAVGVLLYKNWDTVKQKAGELWQMLNDNPFTSFLLKINPVVQVARMLYNNFDDIKASFDRFKNAISNFQLPSWVTSVGSAIGGAASWVASKVPGFDTGIGRVPHDMVAEIHKDEAIIPASSAQMLREMGVIDGDGRYPQINTDNLRDTGGTYQTTQTTQVTDASNSSSVTVQAPVTIIVQGGSTNEETARNLKAELDEYFANLLLIMEG